MPTDDILVSICCLTYNHEKYIKDCLNGFLCQKTNFKFEVLIHDDASTDSTPDIIRQYEALYPDIIKPIYQKVNQYSQGIAMSATYLYPIAKGKYIAKCEGDDYWIDPDKLQMQVDFLEENPEYGLCYTKAKVFDQEKQKMLLKNNGCKIRNYEDIFVNGNKVVNLTVIIKKDFLNLYFNEIDPLNKDWKMGDLPLWLYMYKKSKVYFFPKVTGVYRVLKQSASHFTDHTQREPFMG